MDKGIREFLAGLMVEQRRLIEGTAGFLAGYLVLGTLPYVLLDTYAPETFSVYGVVGFFDWGLRYLLFLALMHRGGLTTGGMRSGIGTYFVLNLVMTIPVIVGLLALLLPGLYLLMRWLPAYSRALMTREGASDAMRWSWARTAPWQRPLAMAMLLPLVPFAVSMLATIADSFLREDLDWTGYVALSVFINGTASLGFAAITVYGVAAYAVLLARDAEVGDGRDAQPGSDQPFGTITPQA